MKVETIKAFFTYLTALLVVGGGLFFLYQRGGDPAAVATIAIVSGFVGAALQFLFGAESASRASAAAAQTATAATAAAMAIPPNTLTATQTPNEFRVSSAPTPPVNGDPTPVPGAADPLHVDR